MKVKIWLFETEKNDKLLAQLFREKCTNIRNDTEDINTILYYSYVEDNKGMLLTTHANELVTQMR